MLPSPKGLCSICNDGKEKSLVGGVCQGHYWSGLRQKSKQPHRRNTMAEGATPDDLALRDWYLMRIAEVTGWCWECGELVAMSNFTFAKSSCAHILPKKEFLSVAIHPFNFLFLGAHCGCHARWDSNWDNAIRMKVFPMALDRFNTFYPSVALSERKNISPIFFGHSIAIK